MEQRRGGGSNTMSNFTPEALALIVGVGDVLAQGENHRNVQLVSGGKYQEAFYAVKQLHLTDIAEIIGVHHNQVVKKCMDSLIARGVFKVHETAPGTPGYYSIRLTDMGQQLYEKEKQRLSSP